MLVDAAVLACTFPSPSVVLKCNQLYSEMRNVRAFFMTLPRECFVLYCKTIEHRSRKSRDLLQTREFTSGDKVTHFLFCRDSFQCSCMRTVVRLFLHVSSISAYGSGRDYSCCWTACLITFHLGTVCVCLTWSSPLPRYCCCVDCLH